MTAPRHHAGMAALSLGALGVVFGDIGTSPVPYFHLPDDRTIVMAAHVEL